MMKKIKQTQKVKSIFVKDAGVKPISPFNTLEEEANFWDTHSLVDKIDDGTLVGFHTANKSQSLTIRFQPKDIQAVREEAFKLGVGPTTLIRMWVKEKMQSSH